MKRVAILFADGFEEVEAVTPLDFLRRAGIDAIAVGVTARDVVGGHDIRVNTDITLDELTAELDAVVIPGGTRGAENIAADKDAVDLVSGMLESGKLVAAICAAPAIVLAGNGLIGDRTFTCFPGFEKRVSSGTFTEERVVVDGNLLTSRGPGTAAEFSEAIITYLVGSEEASKVHDATLQKA
jgi:4-methyl-5(b-hydroxyethyl)-thiazole monophosphate biosynthesis